MDVVTIVHVWHCGLGAAQGKKEDQTEEVKVSPPQQLQNDLATNIKLLITCVR